MIKPGGVIAIFRSFDEVKAREFYLDFLGFDIVFEHRFDPKAPLYMGVARDGFELHLSEHHGDATPGGALRIEVDDIEAMHTELNGKSYKYARPGIVDQTWGWREIMLTDPFGNRLVFCQPLANTA